MRADRHGEVAMSFGNRIAAVRGWLAGPNAAEATLVAVLLIIGAIVLYLFAAGELARLIEATTPYAPGS